MNCVAAPDFWTLTETGKYCVNTISEDFRDSLGDCKTYCETNGAKRLTFFPNNYCRCCTASSELSVTSANSKIYTLQGNYMYLDTIYWCRKIDFLLMIDVQIFFLVCLQASILIKTSRHYNDMDCFIHIVVSNNEKHVKQSEKYKRWTLPFSLL